MISAATAAREMAFAPYSNFRVGAALLGPDQSIYTGCNVESATYGLTMCAERVALFKAISEGNREFVAIAVVADSEKLTHPCGACRQMLWEMCGNIPVYLSNLRGLRETVSVGHLLPEAFDGSFLG